MAGQVLEGVYIPLCFSYSGHASMPFMSDVMTGDSHKCLAAFLYMEGHVHTSAAPAGEATC